MAFKMKGPSLYRSPFKQSTPVPKPKKSTTSAHGQEDDAAAEYETDKKLYEAYLKKKNEQDDKALDKKEDAEGKGKGSNRKVMKDGYVNPTQKKKLADRNAEYDKKTPAEKKALQDAANDKADKFHKRGKYAVTPKKK